MKLQSDGNCAAVAELGLSLTPEANCVFSLTGGFSMRGTSLSELRVTVYRWFQSRAPDHVSSSYNSMNIGNRSSCINKSYNQTFLHQFYLM